MSPDLQKTVYRVSDLSQLQATAFSLAPDPGMLNAIAHELDLSALRKLRFAGTITAQGRHDWRIDAQLGATVVQPCVATLEPVTTRVDAPVTRVYLADYAVPEGAEVEMPEDDTVEPLPAEIDLAAIMIEALALHIPSYPRSDRAGPVTAQATEPGKVPLQDADLRPFAGLAALRDKLSGEG